MCETCWKVCGWKIWDAFGMDEAVMTGYWVASNPVRTDDPEIRATVYRKPGKALIALASWAKGPALSELRIDWNALGIDPIRARIRAPEIPGVQFETSFRVGERIPFEPAKGWILIVD